MARQKGPFDAVQFTRESAERVARVVRDAETAPPQASPLTFAKQFPVRIPRQVRAATFSGAWPIGSTKNVTFKYAPTATANVVNLVCGLSPAGLCDVSVAMDGTTWILLQPNLTQLPGYSISGTHVVSIINGNLQFIGTTAC